MKCELKIMDDRGRTVMSTSYIECFPSKSQIVSMVQNGYKFRLNNKMVSKKVLEEFIKENEEIKE